MSEQRRASSSKRIPQLSTPDAGKLDSDMASLDQTVYKCTCGTPDASGDWICCDGKDCAVQWYHWECVWVTEEPSGDWLCPRCNPKSNKHTKPLKRQGGKMPIFRKLGKMVSTDPHDALDRANRSGKVVADKTPVRVKKGTAIKKTPPKKSTSRWKGWVEITSECEEADQESIGAAHGAVFAEGKARAARSKEKLTGSRMLRGTSKLAARVMEETRLESKDEEMDEEGSTREADPQIPTIAVSKSIYPPEIAANPTTPAVGSQVLQSPPSALPDSSQDSIFAITLRHPSEVPSTLPASGAAMVIDTDEQGWTPIITSLAPDGSSSVDYWSYRTNTWCTIPRSAIRSTLLRLL